MFPDLSENPKLFKVIHRIPEKLNVKIKNEHITQFSLGLFIILHFEKNGNLNKLTEYFKEEENNIETFSLGGRKIKKRKGNYTDIQETILKGYVNGYFGYGDYFGDETLYRYIHHNVEDKSTLFFRKLGIETEGLRYLKNVIESKYNSKEKIWLKFRELVSISITKNTNCLTREYLEKNDPGFIRDCFRLEKIKTNSWETILKVYGLSPDVWGNSYSVISHKGNIFQKSIYELIRKHLKEVDDISNLNNESFIHNKLLSKGIKPDFVFKNQIVDSKLSVYIDKNNQLGENEKRQIEKYLNHFNKPVMIITLNQKGDYFLINKTKIKNINFRTDFQNWMSSQFSVKVTNKEISEVFSRVNNLPFWKV